MSINTLTAYSIEVYIPWGGLKETVAWCEENCTGDYRYVEVPFDPDLLKSFRWKFFFENEKDYVTFMLWKA